VNVNAWSPDGQWVLFDATVGGNTDPYVVRADGSGLRRLTDDAASEYDGEWSRDGRWIYYVSEASGSPAIWRMPSSGGHAGRITSEAGFDPRASLDGRTIYFVDRRRTFGMEPGAALKQVPAGGGTASLVYADIPPGAWEVTEAGILFVDARAAATEALWHPSVLTLYDPAAGRVTPLGAPGFRVAPFGTTRYFIASRDGRWVLASHIDRWERDILVLDGFR
jgi:dipeptidyl aminopeptidase/acylaminoacyl peptidase